MPSNFFLNETNPEIFNVTPRVGGIANIKIAERPKKQPPTSDGASKSGSRVNTASRTKSSSSRTKTSASRTKNAASKSKTNADPSSPDTETTPRKSLLTGFNFVANTTIDLDIDTSPRQLKVKETLSATPWSVEFDDYLDPPEQNSVPDEFQTAVNLLASTISVIMLLSTGYRVSDEHLTWAFSYLHCMKDDFDRIPPNIQGMINHISYITGGALKWYNPENDEPSDLKGVRIAEGPPEVEPLEPDDTPTYNS